MVATWSIQTSFDVTSAKAHRGWGSIGPLVHHLGWQQRSRLKRCLPVQSQKPPQKLRFFEKKKEGETRHGFLEELGGWSSEKLRKGDWESPTCAGRSVIPTCQPCPIVAGGLCTSCYIPFQDANYVTNICIYVLFIYLFIHLFIYLLTYLLTYLCVSLFLYFLIYLSICTYTHIHASIYIHICMCIYRHRSKTIYSYTRNISSYIYDYTYNYIYIYHLICIVCI